MLVFSSVRDGPFNLYRKTIGGMHEEEPLLVSALNQFPSDWSRDGRFLVYMEQHPEMGGDLWILPMTGEKKPIPYVHTAFSEVNAKISPDGHWLAYVSNESGRDEIYVGSFPVRERTWRISAGGGSMPAWRGDGRELFYIATDMQMMAVPVETRDGLKAGTPHALFPTGIVSSDAWPYVVSRDGQRFLLIATRPGVFTTPITVALDWTADPKR